MMDDLEIISKWLSEKEIVDFYKPIKIEKIIDEIYSIYNYKIDKKILFELFDYDNQKIIYKLFENPSGHKSKSRPHCLYLYSQDYLGIDQEDCLRNGLKIFLYNKGYDIEEGIAQIDLIAEKENQIYLFEIKGKQAYDFATLAFAQGLEQSFPLDIDDYIFRLRKKMLFNDSRTKKGQLYNFKTKKHKHIILLIPGFSPTMIWKSSSEKIIFNQVYDSEVTEFRNFILNENSQSVFSKYLNAFNNQINIKEHYNGCDNSEWCFHLIEFKGLCNNIDFAFTDSISGKNYMFF